MISVTEFMITGYGITAILNYKATQLITHIFGLPIQPVGDIRPQKDNNG